MSSACCIHALASEEDGPMAFELAEYLRTGFKHLDEDHRNLISRVSLVAEIEQSGDTAALVAALSEFKTDLANHFANEEIHLRAVNYSKLGSHVAHHADTI